MSRHPKGSSYPIAHCPNCGCAVMYANNPKEKRNVTVLPVSANYQGPMHRCARCDAMFAVIEKMQIAERFVVIPIVGSVS